MKRFHFSDVLSITTGRLVSTRHMDGVYEILNWMTDDQLFTHQLPRASRECEPVLCALYPELSEAALTEPLKELVAIAENKSHDKAQRGQAIHDWLFRAVFPLVQGKLPIDEAYTLLVPRLKEHQHTRINPIEEAEAMVGKGRVLDVEVD